MSIIILFVACVFFLTGCGTAQKQAPHMGFGNFEISTEMARGDVVILDRVEGSSSTATILGFIQIIDDDKLKLFGIPFFKDKYTYFGKKGLWASTADRAYYKALEAAPEADAIFMKSMDHEDEGIPILLHTKTITWTGKAIKLKEDL